MDSPLSVVNEMLGMPKKHFGWTFGAILKYPNFDSFYPQPAIFGIFEVGID